MTASDLIEIHEFSTGIEVKLTASGWESGGFTGEYMNRTIDPIPPAVLNAITNREFALAEGAVADVPTLVGREVTGYGETWSVVAVVTRGRDDRGRGVSLYRYFLCRRERGIETILRWMGSQVRGFDPFDKKAIGQPHQVAFSSTAIPLKDEFRTMLGQSPPIIIPASQPCMPLLLNQMTQELRTAGNRSWAYKVAALEHPEYFQIIYPADARAETVIQQTLAQGPSRLGATGGDAAIKAAIKAVMNGRVKPEHIATLENALSQPQIDEKSWYDLFNQQGADQALKGKLYGDRNVRLLTLKAMLLPKFLPNFLLWLHNSEESENQYIASQELQAAILAADPKFLENCPQIADRLQRGICYVISKLTQDKQKILDEAILLLTSSPLPGLWRKAYQESLLKELLGQQNSLSLNTKYPEWNNTLKDISKFWRFRGIKQEAKYLPLAKLFEQVGPHQLAAIFYQIAEGSVPKSVFFNLSRAHHNQWQTYVFGMTINRRMDAGDYMALLMDWFFYEQVNIGGIMTRVALFLGIFVIFIFGVSVGRLSVKITDKTTVPSSTGSGYSTEPTPTPSHPPNEGTPSPTPDSNPSTPSESMSQENLKNYNKTNEAIKKIETKLNLTENQLKPEIIAKIGNNDTKEEITRYCIKEVLSLPKNFPYEQISTNNEKWTEFSAKIKKYQGEKGSNTPDGVIDPDGQTAKWLEADIKKKCLKTE